MARNIVITGANRGIGLALTKSFLDLGDNVYAACRQPSQALVDSQAKVIDGVDVTTEQGLAALASALTSVKIDILICNAGILRDENLSNFNINTITEQFDVNALAPLQVVHALESKLEAGSKIAMITSRMGSIADNSSGGRFGYRMSKAALNIASVSLAKDLASRNIAVGIYHPGYVQTDMVNHGGDISAAECAQRLTKLMNDLTMAESGVFRHSNGEKLPW